MGQDGVVFLQFSFKWIDNAKLAEILASTEKEKKKKKKKTHERPWCSINSNWV